MRKNIWVLLLGVLALCCAGISVAQLAHAAIPDIACNHPCFDSSDCNGECPSCLGGGPTGGGKCSDVFAPR